MHGHKANILITKLVQVDRSTLHKRKSVMNAQLLSTMLSLVDNYSTLYVYVHTYIPGACFKALGEQNRIRTRSSIGGDVSRKLRENFLHTKLCQNAKCAYLCIIEVRFLSYLWCV